MAKNFLKASSFDVERMSMNSHCQGGGTVDRQWHGAHLLEQPRYVQEGQLGDELL